MADDEPAADNAAEPPADAAAEEVAADADADDIGGNIADERTDNDGIDDADDTTEPKTVDDYRRKMLADRSVYIGNKSYNGYLQDQGTNLSAAQKEQLKKNKNKRFTKQICHGDKLYPQLYQLACLIYIKMTNESYGAQYFTRTTSTKSNAVHPIGQFIANNRIKVPRGDFHTHQSEEFQALLKDDDYKDKDVIYYLPQREMLNHFFGTWGVDFSALLKPTVDDKLRLLGIVLTHEEMKDYIPDIMDKRRGEGGWQPIDSASSRARAAWPILLRLFTDADVKVLFPGKWIEDEFKQRINDKAGDPDFYSNHGNFNPNNKERMALPWDTKTIKFVFKDGHTDYEGMMKYYTMGTGGGDGAPENFADWWDRDESHIMTYTPQRAQLFYLAIVFMWDKLKNFPLTPPCAKMPPGCGREDEEGDDSSKTPVPTKSNKSDGTILKAIEKFSEKRMETTKELINAIQGKDDSDKETGMDSKDRAALIVERISKTWDTQKKFEEDLTNYKNKRTRIETKYATDEKKKKKKMKKVDGEITSCKEMIKSLKKTLDTYRKDLNDVNNDGTKRLNYDGNESDSSSASGSSNSSNESDSD